MTSGEKTGAWARYRAIAREMAAEGHSLVEVADTLGIHKTSLEEALQSSDVRFGNHGRHRMISCFITLRRIAYFRAAAALRGVSIGSLISRLLAIIADDDLLKSVLDDNPRGPRKRKPPEAGSRPLPATTSPLLSPAASSTSTKTPSKSRSRSRLAAETIAIEEPTMKFTGPLDLTQNDARNAVHHDLGTKDVVVSVRDAAGTAIASSFRAD